MEAIRKKMHTFANKILNGRKRQLITALAAFFIVYVLLVSGIFSYFHSKDSVTNRLNAKSGSVTIREPSWDSSGQFMAKASEPGMKIDKDPSGYNNGQVDLYIRLKMTIELSELSDAEKADKTTAYREKYLTDDNRIRRLQSIAEHIRLENDEQLLTLEDTDNAVSEWKIASCGSKSFKFEQENKSADNDKLEFYFYYTGENSEGTGPNDTMAAVSPDTATDELFDHIDIPIYKKDYLGVFDQPYNITLEAEGVPVSSCPDGFTAADAMDSDSPFNG